MTGGAGADSIDFSGLVTHHSKIVGGAGNDTFNFGAAGQRQWFYRLLR